MAKLDGGIFSKPSGKTGGVVFGAARTRQGKVATVRQLVPPSNPNTTKQQTQRNKFKESLAIVRKIGKSIYGSDFNRAISQLPGFQSLMSILMNNMDDSFTLSAPPDINLGTLYTPGIDSVGASGTTGGVMVDWLTDLGPNGDAGDDVVILYIGADAAATPEDRVVKSSAASADRADGTAQESGWSAGADVLVGMYMRGDGPNAGLLSNVSWQVGSAAN